MLVAAGNTAEEAFELESEEVINALLEDGLRALLSEASRRNVLEHPYGRPDPEELLDLLQSDVAPIKELAILADDDDDDDDDDEDDQNDDDDSSQEEEEPKFKPLPFQFDYGFNALGFLGRHLHKYHPRNIARRADARKAHFTYLCKRAEYAKAQLGTALEMRGLAERLRSGLVLGPYSGSVTTTSAVLWARAIKPGKIQFEYSEDPDFASSDVAVAEAGPETDMTARAQLEHLEPGHTYYCRAFLVNPSLGLHAPPEAASYKSCRFTPLPEHPSGSDHVLRFALVSGACLPIQHQAPTDNSQQPSPSMTLPDYVLEQLPGLNFVLFMGGMVPPWPPAPIPPKLLQAGGPTTVSAIPIADLRRWYRREYYSGKIMRCLQHVPLMMAWNDMTEGSSDALMQEEELIAAHAPKEAAELSVSASGSKKSAGNLSSRSGVGSAAGRSRSGRTKDSKKEEHSPAPTPRQQQQQQQQALNIPLRPAFQAHSEFFPIRNPLVRGHCFWKTTACGDLLELYFLDTRNGKLGLRQAKWLFDSIKASKALWKVVVSGSSVGYVWVQMQPPPSAPDVASQDEGKRGALTRSPSGRSIGSRKSSVNSLRSGLMSPPTPSRAGSVSSEDMANGAASTPKHRPPALSRKKSGLDNKANNSLGRTPSSSNLHSTGGSSSGTIKTGSSGASARGSQSGQEEGPKVTTLTTVVKRLQSEQVKNVLLLSGGSVPFPYVVAISPDEPDSAPEKKASAMPSPYYELGVGSLVPCERDAAEIKLEAHRSLPVDPLLRVKELVPMMIGSYFGTITISKTGRVKYSIHAANDGSRKQWFEFKPTRSNES